MTATQADVALLAGVARKTVSNVINGYPHISPAVRERVLAAIDELDYRPSHAARSLRSGRSKIIGLAVPELDVPYFAELGRLIVKRAEEAGMTVIVMQTLGQRARELAVVNGDYTQIVDGLIYSPVSLHGAELTTRKSRSPLLLLGERSSDGLIDHVGIDNVAAARAATEHLIDIGRRRIAFIGAQQAESSEMARQRVSGYRQALQAAGIVFEPELLIDTLGYHREDGLLAVQRILHAKQPLPEALFCATDLLAQGAIRALLNEGIKVGTDVAVVGFDDLDEGRYSTPTLTTISPDKHEIAEAAVTRLVDQAGGAELPARNIVTSFQLIVRESTGG